MKKFVLIAIATVALTAPAQARAGGVIIESIKSHMQAHGGDVKGLPAQPTQPQKPVTPAPVSTLEQLRRLVLEPLGLGR